MSQAGASLGRALRRTYAMTGFPQAGLHLLGLIGKGHNGGDALLAFLEMAQRPGYVKEVTLILAAPREALKPHTGRALGMLEKVARLKLWEMQSEAARGAVSSKSYDIALDGLLGMQFKPPLREGVRSLIEAVNASGAIRLRAAVDLPSGVGDESDEGPFRADVTFATGIVKAPLLPSDCAGAIRYLDLGFFEEGSLNREFVVADSILDPLRSMRASASEKRQHGHLAILAGSRSMPGALAMTVKSAITSGVGLVTAFAPESIVAQLACQLPEAMWKIWPETPEGGLALEGLWQIKAIADKASCLLAGPGMGSDAESQALLREVGKVWSKAAVLDADALRPAVVDAFASKAGSEVVVTPHDGEFMRLTEGSSCSDAALLAYAKSKRITVVKKGANTRISDGTTLCVNPSGNAVLARGGSGDLLAGLIAGLLAEKGSAALETACRGVYWHGKAADLLAVDQGQVAVRTTDLLKYLSAALRS